MQDTESGVESAAPPPGPLETTASLLELVRAGDAAARERLALRYLPRLRRWTHGRLPLRARGLVDTDDIVQIALVKALDQVKRFDPRRAGAFLAYLRRIAQNQMIDELRRALQIPEQVEIPADLAVDGPSTIEVVTGRERLKAYEAAMETLSEREREAVVMRIELGFTYPEVAEAMGFPTPNAARMCIVRALVRLAEVMRGNG